MFSAATYSPTGTPRSTIGAGGLNCRVRHGTGCVPSAMTTENFPLLCVSPANSLPSHALLAGFTPPLIERCSGYVLVGTPAFWIPQKPV